MDSSKVFYRNYSTKELQRCHDIPQNIGLLHQTNWDNNVTIPQQQINKGNPSSSVQQEQINWVTKSPTMSHLQLNVFNECNFETTTQNGPNITIGKVNSKFSSRC